MHAKYTTMDKNMSLVIPCVCFNFNFVSVSLPCVRTGYLFLVYIILNIKTSLLHIHALLGNE